MEVFQCPCVYWAAAIFFVVTKYSNLFFSFTFFLNCSHFTFGYELIIGSESTDIMKIICDSSPFVQRDKSLLLYFSKIHCFQSVQCRFYAVCEGFFHYSTVKLPYGSLAFVMVKQKIYLTISPSGDIIKHMKQCVTC